SKERAEGGRWVVSGSATRQGWRLCLSRAMIASPCTTRRGPHDVEKHTPHPRRGQPGGPLASALGSSRPLGGGLRALFFLRRVHVKGVEQTSITRGGAYGEHGQHSGADRSLGTADASAGSPYPHGRASAALVARYCLRGGAPGPREPAPTVGHSGGHAAKGNGGSHGHSG